MGNPNGVERLHAGATPPETLQRRFRLVLADDHHDVLDAIRDLLEPEFEVLDAVTEGLALVESVSRLRPDAVISDIRMPRLGGIEAGAQLLRGRLCTAVILLTMHNEPHLVKKALQAGIRGYVLKVDAGEELIPAVYAVLGGDRYLSRGVLDTWRE